MARLSCRIVQQTVMTTVTITHIMINNVVAMTIKAMTTPLGSWPSACVCVCVCVRKREREVRLSDKNLYYVTKKSIDRS